MYAVLTPVKFRWVACQIDAVRRCLKLEALRSTLASLPETLDETYSRILLAIDPQYQEEARRALLWLSFAKRPLSIKELAEAAVFKESETPSFDIEERLRDPYDILEILGSLVIMSSKSLFGNEQQNPVLDVHSGDIDEGSLRVQYDTDDEIGSEADRDMNTGSGLASRTNNRYLQSQAPERDSNKVIRLAHYSVQEFLVSQRILQGPTSQFGTSEIAANTSITACCLQYILYYKGQSSDSVINDLEEFPLLDYACRAWHVHLKTLPREIQVSMTNLAMELLNDSLMVWIRIYDPAHRMQLSGIPLHFASLQGLQTIIEHLLDAGENPNTPDRDETPLCAASRYGQAAAVRLLIKARAELNTYSIIPGVGTKWTALHVAVQSGSDETVRLLIEAGANVHATTPDGKTALEWLFSTTLNKPEEEMVRLLLNAGAEVNILGEHKLSFLHLAAQCGNEAVLHALIQAGIDVNIIADDNGGTALHKAVKYGTETATRVLLGAGVDIEARALLSQETALHKASTYGTDAVVALLLEAGADIGATDLDGYTALHKASKRSDPAIVKLLLQAGADINARAIYNETALRVAKRYGNEAVVQVLTGAKTSTGTSSLESDAD
jgi:ankyrin repeat protein